MGGHLRRLTVKKIGPFYRFLIVLRVIVDFFLILMDDDQFFVVRRLRVQATSYSETKRYLVTPWLLRVPKVWTQQYFVRPVRWNKYSGSKCEHSPEASESGEFWLEVGQRSRVTFWRENSCSCVFATNFMQTWRSPSGPQIELNSDRIGRHKTLLSTNHRNCNFRKKNSQVIKDRENLY